MDIYDNSLTEQIELRMIKPSQSPIRYLDPKNSPELINLKLSIKEHGLLQPIVIRPLKHGFEIVAGHRRFMACKSLRWRCIPCKIREFSDKHAFEIQLTENLQRKTMNPIEEAEAFQKYVVDFGWGGMSDLGNKIGKSEEYVSHRMQLLKLSDDIKEKITSDVISLSQALELTNINFSINKEFVNHIVDNDLTIKEIRKIKNKLKIKPIVSREASKSKANHIIRKSSIALKITLSRIDDLIEDAHQENPKERIELIELLMNLRRQTHSMIDSTLKYKKNNQKTDTL